MGSRLPAAAEQSQHTRFCGGQILRPDRAQRRDAQFLNDAVGHDRDRLDSFDIEEDDESAIFVTRRDRQDAAPLHTGRIGVSCHVRGDSQSPNAGPRTTAFLRFESIAKAGIIFGFGGQIHLTARPVQSHAFREFAINLLGCRDRVFRNQCLFHILVGQQ